MIQLHDNMSFEEKRDVGLDHFEGEVTIVFEAHGANESDVKMQFLQTIAEMDTAELIKKKDEFDFNITD